MTRRSSGAAASYVRNFIFGVEDSLVSTVGLLSGIAIGGVPRATIFLTGIVLIFVEAISMAAGSFLSEYSAEEYSARGEVSAGRSIAGGAIMFFSYFISGFVPLLPYMLLEVKFAFWISIGVSLAVLGALGVWGAQLAHVRVIRNVVRMVVVGGVAIAVGIIVGKLVDGSGP